MRKHNDVWTSEYVAKHRRRRLWQRIVSVLSCAVVFCTTYALILPAITAEKETFCGIEEHTHTDECYAAVADPVGETLPPETEGRTLICSQEEIPAHKHDENCMAPAHSHSDDCYGEPEFICGMEEGSLHIHTDACYGDESLTLTCTLAEEEGHTHTDACYTLEPGPLTCTLEEREAHSHLEGCYDENGGLTCTEEESEGHTHGEGCYGEALPALACGMEEKEGHTHGEECYTSEGKPLLCTLSDMEPHVHTDACCGEPPVICGLQEREAEELICTLEETDGHTHSDTCYETAVPAQTVSEETAGERELVCGLEEHTHELICFSDKTADVETAAEWERTLPGDLTGVWREDVLAIAVSQLGYEESTRNYVVENEEVYGYSRYGDWYADPYGDWCAMFASFCLDYAGVEGVPYDSTCQDWVEELTEAGLYEAGGDYVPQPGDLIFFDYGADGTSNHVGLVESVTEASESAEAKVHTIEGNSGDRVQRVTYNLSDRRIMGYARIPYQLSAEEQTQIDSVIAMIDAMPSAGEIDAKILEYEEAEDDEGLEDWYTGVVQQVAETYQKYSYLTDIQKSHVTNADKLLELEYIWSQAILIDEIVSDAPTVVGNTGENPAVSTSDFVKLNIYDYYGAASVASAGKKNINDLWKSNKKYPGFQWNGGAYMTDYAFRWHRVDNIDFGNSMITDFSYGGSNSGNTDGISYNYQKVGGQGGAINQVIGYTNQPIGYSSGSTYDALKHTLIDRYPALSDGTSLKYLFTESDYADKKNTANIDGLFRQNQITGEYWYDSRDNHAYYSGNRFTLYNQIITPNFILYPFGNFLPFNSITNGNQVTQVTKIERVVSGTASSPGYMQTIINRLLDGSVEATEQQLVDMLAKYRDTQLSNVNQKSWSAEDAINYYFQHSSEFQNDNVNAYSAEIQEILERLYNIDFNVKKNFFFGMDMEMNFMQPKDGYTGKDTNQDGKSDYPMKFYFAGDDDVWICIDGILFLDLSGIHRHVGGDIDFVNGKVNYYMMDSYIDGAVESTPYKTYTFAQILRDIGGIPEAELGNYLKKDSNGNYSTFKDYSSHNFKFYYMERGSGSSVCRINFNFPLLRQNSISVQKEVSADTAIKGNPDYKFQVLKADSSGKKTENLFIAEGTKYTIYDAGDNVVGTGVTDANGVFVLKAGQRAEFTGIKENAGKYYVRELLEGTVLEQYGNITVSGESTTTSHNVTIGSESFTGMDSPVKDMSDGATAFRFTNDVDEQKLGSLSVSKVLNEYGKAGTAKTYDVEVTLDGEKLPVGTKYTVGGETRTVEKAGIITIAADETATIGNILAGTAFAVQETSGSAEGYTVTYRDSGGYEITVTDGMVTGIIKTSAKVQLVVTNSEKGTTVTIPGTKAVANPDGVERTYTFRLDEVTDFTGATLKAGGITNYTATATVTDSGSFSFTINYVQVEQTELPATFYYRITEDGSADGSWLANDTVYVAEVTVNTDETGDFAAYVSRMRKNGVEITEKSDYSADFVNTITGGLTLEKIVDGGTEAQNQGFTFTITLTAGEGITLPTAYPAVFHQRDGTVEEVTLTLNDSNQIVLNDVKHGEKAVLGGIPVGVSWKIEETGAEGFVVETSAGGTNGSGTVTEGSVTTGNTSVVYTNRQTYVLPETGGAGTTHYIMAGLVLVLGALCLMYIAKKRRKEDSFS